MSAKQFHSWCLTDCREYSVVRQVFFFCFVYSKAIRLHFCFIDMTHELLGISGLIKRGNNVAQCGARTHYSEIKSLNLYQPS